MIKILRTEIIGKATLYLVEHTEVGWDARVYSIERTVTRDDGSCTPRVCYGVDGFSDLSDAMEFGREWCQTVGRY
jgi:hypothetical protein